jgi:repressor LexA
MSKQLTIRQQEVLGFLQVFQQEYGYWPSVREIKSHFQFKSTNAVFGHLNALEQKGYIARTQNIARAFKITYQNTDEVPAQSLDVVSIPLYGSIPAGFPDGVEPSGEIGRLQIDIETAGLRRSRRSFALKVRGDSMINAGIYDGDIVIVEPGLPEHKQIVAALIDGETTLKRFMSPGRGKLPYLQAENPEYPELHPVEELVIQGIVRAVVRHLD